MQTIPGSWNSRTGDGSLVIAIPPDWMAQADA
jgi:hypothetical protein